MEFSKSININSRIISESSPVFIIAEAGVNHNGDISLAKELINVAANTGVDAVKFQAFKAENIILKNVEKADYQKKTTSTSESQYQMLKKLELNFEQNLELLNYCISKNIIFLSTPFDEESLSDLLKINVPALKVASTDLTNLPFLEKIARSGKPILLSTGMSYLSEVELALKTIYPYNNEVILLQCTANYPIADKEANLNVITTYRSKFNLLVGYSDHSIGIGAAPYAVPMGAKVIEKHFTLDKNSKGPDHLASLTPNELKEFVVQVRKVEDYLGSYIKKPSFSESKTRRSMQKCLVAFEDISKGALFTDFNITAKRTGGIGISPIYYKDILGKKSTRLYKKNEIIDE